MTVTATYSGRLLKASTESKSALPLTQLLAVINVFLFRNSLHGTILLFTAITPTLLATDY